MLHLVTERRPSTLVLPQEKKQTSCSYRFSVFINGKGGKKRKKLTYISIFKEV